MNFIIESENFNIDVSFIIISFNLTWMLVIIMFIFIVI